MVDSNKPKRNKEITNKMNLHCRFYRQTLPEKDELVMVQVTSIQEVGAYVHLLEYNDIEGMIMLSEVSKRRIRSVNKIIRVGKNEVAVVLRVDPNKGYIDLSKKKVSAQEVEECEQKFAKSRKVHTLLATVAQLSSFDLEVVYEQVGWPLYDKFGHAFDGLKLTLTEPEQALEGLSIEPKIREVLIEVINNKMKPRKLRIRADFEVTCYAYEGIEAIKDALRIGEMYSTEDLEISVKLISAPHYYIETATFDKTGGISTLTDACQAISQAILKNKGQFVLKQAPRAIGERPELENETKKEDISEEEEGSEEEDQEEGMDVDVEGVNVEQIDNQQLSEEEEEEEEEEEKNEL